MAKAILAKPLGFDKVIAEASKKGANELVIERVFIDGILIRVL